jgi:porphobilinogen synthase
MSGFPQVRMRRLRQNEQIRSMLSASMPGPERFMWPLFVVRGENQRQPIDAMPGQYRWSVDRLPEAVEGLLSQGVRAVLLFGLPSTGEKDSTGRAAAHAEGVVQIAVRLLVERYPELLIFTDVCLCAYTTHGHCGPLGADGAVDNDAANAQLRKVAVSHASAGAHGVAPSAMMDGQVAAIRGALHEGGYRRTILMSYSTKFASSMYGPFRDAEQSAPQAGDRKGYQACYGDVRQALRESRLDELEGADMLMVKPGLFYLDVVAKIREATDLPLAVYNVSGEYAMLTAMADRGWGNLREMVRESTMALSRAGADIIISYWAPRYRELFGAE